MSRRRFIAGRANEDDVPAVRLLLTEPPCDVSAMNVERKLGALIGSPSDRVFVAEVDGSVVGLLGVHVAPLLPARERREPVRFPSSPEEAA